MRDDDHTKQDASGSRSGDQQRGDAAKQDAGAHVRDELAKTERRTHDGIPAAPQGDGAGDELARTGTHHTTNPEVGEVGA